jgi:hypothetical protein
VANRQSPQTLPTGAIVRPTAPGAAANRVVQLDGANDTSDEDDDDDDGYRDRDDDDHEDNDEEVNDDDNDGQGEDEVREDWCCVCGYDCNVFYV